MDFTREPIIETVITPKEGYKIVVRSSKNPGSEEYFVDAVEVVTFGSCSFFRSLERPKAFLVPVSDYEILEVREARIVLKNVGLERSIKISGGKERENKPKEVKEEKPLEPLATQSSPEQRQADPRDSRRRDRRRQGRRRREDDVVPPKDGSAPHDEQKIELTPPSQDSAGLSAESQPIAQSILSSLLTPPPTLISETLKTYKENALFKEAFYTKEELEQGKVVEPAVVETVVPKIPVNSKSEFEEFQRSVEMDEQIYNERVKSVQSEPSDTEKL